MRLFNSVLSLLLLSSSFTVSVSAFADGTTAAPEASVSDVKATEQKIARLQDIIFDGASDIPSLNEKMEMTYLNRSKAIWYNDLLATSTFVKEAKLTSEQGLVSVKRLAGITQKSEEMIAAVKKLQNTSKLILEKSVKLNELTNSLRHWKDRIVNELGSTTYLTLDERDLVDAIDDASLKLSADVKQSLKISSELLETLSRQ